MHLRPEEAQGPAPQHWIMLRGVGELAEGQQLKLAVGETIVVGRSRHCDWSLRRTPMFLKSDKDQRKAIRADTLYSSVSRKHMRMSYLAPDMLEIENLSGNGTIVDGMPIDKIVLTDIRTQPHTIQLGPEGVVLELQPGSLPL